MISYIEDMPPKRNASKWRNDMEDTQLSLKNVSFSYHSQSGEVRALDSISFHVRAGEFVAIVGPSGCGKSTILSLIAGLLKPESGDITFYTEDPHDKKPGIGYMLQRDHLFEWRSVYRNIILGLEINHQLTPEKKEKVLAMAEDYGLTPFLSKKPSELSGGLKQRAALVRTMAMEPDILLLDEPFSALDYQTRLNVSADICRIIRSAQKTAILITHDLSEAISLSDRVIVLSSRPARVVKEIPIRLTLRDNSLLAARNAPEFKTYFNLLWEELNHG